MSKIILRNDILEWSFDRGQTASLIINKEDGWNFDEIVMDIKSKREIRDDYIIRLTVGNGLTLSGNKLTARLTSEQTRNLPSQRASADIKVKLSDIVYPSIPLLIIVNPTVTDI